MEEAADQVEECGFPRAIGADDEQYFAFAHLERDVFHSAQSPEALGDVSQLKQCSQSQLPPRASSGAGGLLESRFRMVHRQSCRNPPTIPSGRKSTTTTMRMP